MGWMMEAVTQELPGVRFEDFLRAITETTAEIVRNRPPEYLEIPSRERFRRALACLGIAGNDGAEKAERLSQAHMRHLAAATELPPDHLALLRELHGRYPLGLVSNFDHGPTARAIVDHHGLTPLFASIVISDGFGRRKPHPSIFCEALRQIGIAPVDAVFVGDSLADDVSGAHAAGMAAVWLNPSGAPLPDASAAPEHTIARLSELPEALALDPNERRA
jgi:HAD superfamily hydrolase (TIGR01549 family)